VPGSKCNNQIANRRRVGVLLRSPQYDGTLSSRPPGGCWLSRGTFRKLTPQTIDPSSDQRRLPGAKGGSLCASTIAPPANDAPSSVYARKRAMADRRSAGTEVSRTARSMRENVGWPIWVTGPGKARRNSLQHFDCSCRPGA
jgi:hypothetical protein